jgi:hypothetical protein
MSDQNQTLRDDIAFVRGLAEAGLQTSTKGGSILAASGLIFGTASLVCWWGLTMGKVANGGFYAATWGASAVLFFLAMFLLRREMGRQPGASKAAGLIWGGAGWGAFVVIVSLVIITFRTQQGWVMGVISPVILGTYGATWSVAGSLSGKRWLNLVGFGSALMALVCAWFIQQTGTLYLIYGVTLYALMAAPGLILARQARQAA